jgi:hypothetical protein
MKSLSFNGALIALTCGSLFATACKQDDKSAASAPTVEKSAKVHCQGVNECKGHGGCKSAANACAGQNGCKGQSFVEMESGDACKAKGGTVMAAASMTK